ncbi:MAG: Fic family protein [Alphaproteobacteria bacterium]|nr:Fic family protein [Alphaproteobacteria bacterium]
MNTDISIPSPQWNSELSQVIMDLEKLRSTVRTSTVPPYIFFQLKNIFQLLETLGSARIEGNNTTLSEYVDEIIEKKTSQDEKRQELKNIDEGIAFIEKITEPQTLVDRAYLSEIHKILTQRLTPPPKGEGSNHPGELRLENVEINGVIPPPPVRAEQLRDYFDAFIRFINEEQRLQNQLLMVAIAHHRFMYIHPFDNGNGRMGRLLNYALLIKLGFNVVGRVFNPSSVFYADRNKYYESLRAADSLRDEDLLKWAEYFLYGLKNQIEKINTLMDQKYTVNQILVPTLKSALDRQHITRQEYDVLFFLVRHHDMAIQSKDLEKIGITGSSQKAYVMRKLRDKGMAVSVKGKPRTYTIKFTNNYLLRSVIRVLSAEGFVAESLDSNEGEAGGR